MKDQLRATIVMYREEGENADNRATRDARLDGTRGMTLIETLIAITILAVAIVAPMSLTIQSLLAAYYARDQVIASNLAQEAIESVRAIRDGNILTIALNAGAPCVEGGAMHLLCGIPIGDNFMIDTRDNSITRCNADGTLECNPLQTDAAETLYGYQSGWNNTRFIRTVRAEYVDAAENEIRITVTVTRDGGGIFPSVILYENLYRWVEDGSGA